MKIGVLWDLDGTLLDSLQDLADATNHTLAHYGCPQRSLEEIRQFVGNGARRLIALALPGKKNDPDVDEVLAFYQDYYRAHSKDKTRPYDGIPEALAKIGEKYPVAIVSNKPDGAVKILCEEYFPGVYALGEAPGCARKPAPDMVHKALKDLDLEGCVYVGDSEVDVLTAKNAGVPALSVLWGFRDREALENAGGAYFCRDPRTLPEMIDKIVGEIYGQ